MEPTPETRAEKAARLRAERRAHRATDAQTEAVRAQALGRSELLDGSIEGYVAHMLDTPGQEAAAAAPSDEKAPRPARDRRAQFRRGLAVVGAALAVTGVAVFTGPDQTPTSDPKPYQRTWTREVETLKDTWDTGTKRPNAKPATSTHPGLVPHAAEDVVVSVPEWGRNASWLLREDTKDLNAGPSWFPTTQEPGQKGNVAIIGHRTGWGQPFHEIYTLSKGDIIRVDTKAATFSYTVTRNPFVVGEYDTKWIAPVPGRVGATPTVSSLTLVTCEIPTTTRRVIVTAQLSSVRLRGAKTPAAKPGAEPAPSPAPGTKTTTAAAPTAP